MRTHRIALIPGDGVGPELISHAVRVLDAAQSHDGSFELEYSTIDGGAGFYQRTGQQLGIEARELATAFDSILKAPVGLPHVRTPEGIEAGLLGGVLRNGLDLFANVRPIQSYDDSLGPLRRPTAIDYVIVRENTEGLYASRGRGVRSSSAAADLLLITRAGTERIGHFAFDLAVRRALATGREPRLACVDKSNVLGSYALFRDVVSELSPLYPTVRVSYIYADAMAQALVLTPEKFDVVLTENFLGDILSDLGGATVGGVGMCPSGNYGAESAYFEPAHGSAPSIAGHNCVNPIGQLLSAAMMLDHIGEARAARNISQAVTRVCHTGALEVDAAGRIKGGTDSVVDAILGALQR